MLRLAVGRVRQRPHREAHVVTELPVQLLGGGGRPGRQVQLKWWLPTLIHFWHGITQQRSRLLVAEPDQDHLEFVPNRYAAYIIWQAEPETGHGNSP